jgi:hypothetical protein
MKDKDRREEEKEDKYKKAIETEIMSNRHHNEAIKKLKEDLKQDFLNIKTDNSGFIELKELEQALTKGNFHAT